MGKDIYKKIEDAMDKHPLNEEVQTYIEIMNAIKEDRNSLHIQDTYVKFYKIRKNKVWIKRYFEFMDECIAKDAVPSIEKILDTISDDQRFELSYASKMLATLDDTQPICDKWVRYALMIGDFDAVYAKTKEWKLDVYSKIQRFYGDDEYEYFRNRLVSIFDYKVQFDPFITISKEKKIDFVLWVMGKEGIHIPLQVY